VGNAGAKTALLVVAGVRPFVDGIERSAAYRRAEALISMGQALRIISAGEVCDLIAEAAEPAPECEGRPSGGVAEARGPMGVEKTEGKP
jgi:hypothetical protein